MGDTEKLILLIKREPSIWNTYSPDFSHKNLKLEAWHRIGLKLFTDWDKRNPEHKGKTIGLLKAKWKHIRTSYYKDKQPKGNNKSENAKRKKYPFSVILGFMDSVLGLRRGRSVSKRIANGSSNDEVMDEVNDEVKHEEEGAQCSEENQDPNHTTIVCEPDAPNNLTAETMLQWNEMSPECPQDRSQYSHMQSHGASAEHMMQHAMPSFLGVNPNVAFLISCSQEMDEMTGIQRIEFKSGIMDLIKSIRYPNENVNR